MKTAKEPCFNYTPQKDSPACVCGWAKMAHKSEQEKKSDFEKAFKKEFIEHISFMEGSSLSIICRKTAEWAAAWAFDQAIEIVSSYHDKKAIQSESERLFGGEIK